jgi:hypothetical protein
MNLGNIVGTIAWVTAETLMVNGIVGSKLPAESEKKLISSMAALGIPKKVAQDMAKEPIFLSCIFGEKRTASTDGDSDDAQHGSHAEEEERDTRSTGSDLVVEQPTLIQAQDFSLSLRPRGKQATSSKQEVGDGSNGQP